MKRDMCRDPDEDQDLTTTLFKSDESRFEKKLLFHVNTTGPELFTINSSAILNFVSLTAEVILFDRILVYQNLIW